MSRPAVWVGRRGAIHIISGEGARKGARKEARKEARKGRARTCPAPPPRRIVPVMENPLTPDALFARFDALGIAHRTYTHPPVFTVEEAKALRGTLPGGHCKSLFLKDKKAGLWLVVALEETRVDLKLLADRLGAPRFSFGSADLLYDVLGVRPGSVTPFAAINDAERRVAVVLDRAMLAHDPLNYHPLENDRTTAIAPGDLLRFLDACGHPPRIVDIAPPR
jgi:Ala-tRNA(Pro) deacylase